MLAVNRGTEIHEHIRRAASLHAGASEKHAHETARRGLRPRLRWTIDHPRILGVVYRLGLARRPRVVHATSLFDGRRLPVIPIDELRSTMIVVGSCPNLTFDETSSAGRAICGSTFVDLRGNCERCGARRVSFTPSTS